MPSALRNALNGVKANPKLRKYADDCEYFVNYVEQTGDMWFTAHGQHINGEGVKKDMPYITRFTEIYRKSIVARFYRLETWLKFNPHPITMITLTTYQDGEYSKRKKGRPIYHEEAFELLTDSFRKLRELITNRMFEGHTPDYFWVLEPHLKNDTGYPHMHLAYLVEFTEEEQARIKRLWTETYGAGEQVDFSFRTPEESVRSIRNYLMKYMRKGLLDSGSKFENDKLKPGQLVFNALLKKTNTRMWGCSRHLSAVVKWEPHTEKWLNPDGTYGYEPKICEVVWFKTSMNGSGCDDVTVWESAGRRMLAKFKTAVYEKLAYTRTSRWRRQLLNMSLGPCKTG